MEINKLYNMDYELGLKKLDDNSVDLIISDPPYGDDTGYGRNNKEIKNNSDWRINLIFLKKVYSKLKENKSLYLFTNWKFIDKIRSEINDIGFKERMIIVMIKNNMGMGYGFRNQYELCLVLEKGKAKYNLNNFSNIYKIRHIKQDNKTHPHQKDEFFLQKIIEHSSKEGDLILDCFVGSGSVLVASKNLKRNYLGFEIDLKWFNYANNRLNQKNIHSWFYGGIENE